VEGSVTEREGIFLQPDTLTRG